MIRGEIDMYLELWKYWSKRWKQWPTRHRLKSLPLYPSYLAHPSDWPSRASGNSRCSKNNWCSTQKNLRKFLKFRRKYRNSSRPTKVWQEPPLPPLEISPEIGEIKRSQESCSDSLINQIRRKIWIDFEIFAVHRKNWLDLGNSVIATKYWFDSEKFFLESKKHGLRIMPLETQNIWDRKIVVRTTRPD